MTEPRALPPLVDGLYLFPLPAVQLFPHTLLPLHVFEPRYRELARDSLATSRLIAVPMLEPGYEAHYQGRPAVRPVCGVGEIVQSRVLPDGRYDLLLRGLGRVRILEELPPSRAYRVARAERLDDVLPPGGAATEHAALVALCDRLAAVMPAGGETLRQLARQEHEPGAACDVIASALLTEPGDRQVVLETLDVHARLERVAEALAKLLGHFTATTRPKGPTSLN